MINYLTLVRTGIINKSTSNKCCRGHGEKGTLVHCFQECRLVQSLWKTVWNFLRKLRIELPFDPAIPLLGIYLKNPEMPIQKKLCTPTLITALLQQPNVGNSLSAHQQMSGLKKLWSIYTVEHHTAERKNSFFLLQHGWN